MNNSNCTMLRDYCADLKRAVEDVILRPEENQLAHLGKRSTIAALDLWQIEPCSVPDPKSVVPGDAGSSCCGSTDSTFDQSSSASSSVHNPQLSMSTSLDMMVLRNSLSTPQHLLARSRRSSHTHHHSAIGKRKRSNSVSSGLNKGQLANVANDGPVSLPMTARHTPMRFDDDNNDEHRELRARLTQTSSLSPAATSLLVRHDIIESDESQADSQNDPGQANMANASNNSTAFTAFRVTGKEIGSFEESMDCD